MYGKKEQEIAKIKDRNKRIKKILADLDQSTNVYEPSLGVVEKPEMLMNVADEEVGSHAMYHMRVMIPWNCTCVFVVVLL